ncbi:hypothetical protein RRG08_016264 [Elysia crispata]|uniref:Uncharacterized protein n=1 Tax=Elysia crispata TaxID=231223 RepID=A0AAE1E0A0_9GAST|nr:hypothetical protein RRG08_016264 [Elysia crispata]
MLSPKISDGGCKATDRAQRQEMAELGFLKFAGKRQPVPRFEQQRLRALRRYTCGIHHAALITLLTKQHSIPLEEMMSTVTPFLIYF